MALQKGGPEENRESVGSRSGRPSLTVLAGDKQETESLSWDNSQNVFPCCEGT